MESPALTHMAYVKEQYMSPRKKSRNSTGYSPAKKRRHCEVLAIPYLFLKRSEGAKAHM